MPSPAMSAVLSLIIITSCVCILYNQCIEQEHQGSKYEPKPKSESGDATRDDEKDSNTNPLKQVVNEQLNIHGNNESGEAYDYKASKPFSDYGDGTCPENNYRSSLKELFTKWSKISRQFDVPYFLNFGSLLGAWRNGDLIPNDSDIDISINIDDTPKLEKYGTQYGYRISVQKDWRVPQDYRRRFNCNGDPVESQVDNCAFVEPIARLISLKSGMRIDLYATKFFLNTALMFSDLKLECTRDSVLPLKPCKFMGLDSFCPNKPKTLLTVYYGKNLRPNKVCKNTKWVKV